MPFRDLRALGKELSTALVPKDTFAVHPSTDWTMDFDAVSFLAHDLLFALAPLTISLLLLLLLPLLL